MTKPDVIIIGAGVAGLFTALKLAPRRVMVVTAAPLAAEAASAWAQGGIAAAVGAGDSVMAHAADTMSAGAGHCDPLAVQAVCAEAPARVRDLETFGVHFARAENGEYDLIKEGAHRHPRVLRAAAEDGFGKELMQALVAKVLATPSIQVREGVVATQLGADDQGVSAVALSTLDGQAEWVSARHVVLATGGLGGLYEVTTNPQGAVGSGLKLAADLGANLKDMEFVQFHPTGLDLGRDPAPLATEALRGVGSWLIDADGDRFMIGQHKMAELAPRDVVARGIHKARQATGKVFLDATQAVGAAFPDRFPTVFAACMEAGIDPRVAPMPVAPAAHYHMGGVATDLMGETEVPGLFCVGEVACTGVHGANRLASNSLAEAIVFGARAAKVIEARVIDNAATPKIEAPATQPMTDAVHNLGQAIRLGMAAHAGVERHAAGLTDLLRSLERMGPKAAQHNRTAAMHFAASEVTKAALARRNSLGGHFRADAPQNKSKHNGKEAIA
ncbi:MAG: L-aspartate oxidase [Alphaproteobacteria bacterium]